MDPCSIDQPDHQVENPFKESFVFWERMRIWYNAIVGVVGVFALFMNNAGINEFLIISIAVWALMANAIYSNGFVVECYLIRFNKRKKNLDSLRYGVFVLGTLFSAILTFWVVSSFYTSFIFD